MRQRLLRLGFRRHGAGDVERIRWRLTPLESIGTSLGGKCDRARVSEMATGAAAPEAWWAQELTRQREDLERWARNRTSFDLDAASEIVAGAMAELTARFQNSPTQYPADWFESGAPQAGNIGRFRALVRTVILRRIHDRLRRHYLATAVEPPITATVAVDPEAALDARRALRVLGYVMDKLPERDRELLLRGSQLVPATATMTNRERQHLHRLRRRMLETLRREFRD